MYLILINNNSNSNEYNEFDASFVFFLFKMLHHKIDTTFNMRDSLLSLSLVIPSIATNDVMSVDTRHR